MHVLTYSAKKNKIEWRLLLACTFSSSLTVRLINMYHTHMQVKEMKSLKEVSLITNVHPQRRKSKSVACTLDNKNSIEARKLYCYMVAIK